METEWGSYCTIAWAEGATSDAAAKPAEKKRWPDKTFKRALESALLAHGQKRQLFPDMREVLTVDRDQVRAEFNLMYPADNMKTKGTAFRRYEKAAIDSQVMGARAVGPDLATTVFWIAAHET